MDDLEQAICRMLKEIAEEAENSGWSWVRGNWTTEIKGRLCKLVKALEPRSGVCASACRGADYGEWLYDFCWYVENDAGLMRIPLVVECEWYPDGGDDGDFQKLLQARAEHRAWIFEAKTPEDIDKIFNECRAAIGRFRDTSPGDRYLFAGLGWSPREFRFAHYIHAGG